MKVYIVTDGSYSDYHIERVFLEKEKAEHFSELIDGDVGEYETDDDKQFEDYNVIRCWYNFIGEFTSYFTNIVGQKYALNKTAFSIFKNTSMNNLYLQRVVPNDSNEEDMTNKYKKVCYDIFAEIKYHKEVDGWSDKMIQEWVERR